MDTQIAFKFDKEEQKRLKEIAKKIGLPMASFCRQAVLERMRYEIDRLMENVYSKEGGLR